MLQARCDYAVHLDMNPGLVGLRALRRRADEHVQAARRARSRRDWEYEGTFKRDSPISTSARAR